MRKPLAFAGRNETVDERFAGGRHRRKPLLCAVVTLAENVPSQVVIVATCAPPSCDLQFEHEAPVEGVKDQVTSRCRR